MKERVYPEMILRPLLVLLLTISQCVWAEIYRWQDEQGNWHFSDAPKTEHGKPSVIRGSQSGFRASDQSLSPGEDIAIALEEKFKPQSVVERVTLAVVGIETHLGEGSGFFVSDQGYIVTNRHVIRPSTTDAWQQGKEQLENGREQLRAFQKKLDDDKRSLDDYAIKLERYREDVESKPDGSARKAALAEYEGFEKRYQQRLRNHQAQQKAQNDRMREFERNYSEFSLKDSMAGAARQFKVVLKDNTELRAQLVKISKDYDLALLKLDGYRTPSLALSNSAGLRQGRQVFAVGSPLGMKDAVTSGIITSLKEHYLVTDAQILPGNSGGPLLDHGSGEVLGVNTLKFAQSALSDGFGFAIPSEVVKNEFAQYLGSL